MTLGLLFLQSRESGSNTHPMRHQPSLTRKTRPAMATGLPHPGHSDLARCVLRRSGIPRGAARPTDLLGGPIRAESSGLRVKRSTKWTTAAP